MVVVFPGRPVGFHRAEVVSNSYIEGTIAEPRCDEHHTATENRMAVSPGLAAAHACA